MAYTFASHGKIGSRPAQLAGTSRAWLISRHFFPGASPGQLGTTYSDAGFEASAVWKSEKFAITTTPFPFSGRPRCHTTTRLPSLKSTWRNVVSLTLKAPAVVRNFTSLETYWEISLRHGSSARAKFTASSSFPGSPVERS